MQAAAAPAQLAGAQLLHWEAHVASAPVRSELHFAMHMLLWHPWRQVSYWPSAAALQVPAAAVQGERPGQVPPVPADVELVGLGPPSV